MRTWLFVPVLAPEMSGFRALRVRPQDAREIADAFRYARSRPELWRLWRVIDLLLAERRP